MRCAESVPQLVVLAALTAACGQTPRAPATGAGTRAIQLPDGSTLHVPERPSRVLPANSRAVDLIVELLPPERVVAVPQKAFEWSRLAATPGPWAQLPVMESFNGEEILTLDPDLLLVSTWSEKGPLEAAKAAGVPILELPDATSWEEVLAGVELAGRALDEQQRAASLIEDLERRRAELRAADRPRRRALPYANFGSGGYTSGSGTTLDLVIELAGLENAAASAGLRGHAEISLEEVLIADPDLFVTSSVRDGVRPGASFLRNEQILADLQAVRADHIMVIPAELYASASHRVLDAAEELARQVDAMLARE